MKKLNIDLGKSYKESMPSVQDMKDEMSYPSFHVDGDKDLGLPYEGVMLVRYCKREENKRTDADGDKHYSCQIQVKEIISVEADEDTEAPSKSYSKDSEDAIDALAKKKLRKKSDAY